MNGCHLHPSAPRGDQSEDKAPICPLLQREFWLPGSQLSGAQAATAGFVLLTMQSDTPRVCLSLEKCLSVLELWRRWTQGCFHECCVLFIFLRVICCGMLWGCISRSQGFMCLWMRGSPHSPEFQGASPLFFGGRFGSCSTSSLCFSPLPLAKLKCCVGAQAG